MPVFIVKLLFGGPCIYDVHKTWQSFLVVPQEPFKLKFNETMRMHRAYAKVLALS